MIRTSTCLVAPLLEVMSLKLKTKETIKCVWVLVDLNTFEVIELNLNLHAFESPALFQLHDWRLPSPQPSRRKLLQYGGIMPYSPLNVVYNGKTCILFRARKLAIRYRNHTLVDLTQRVFGPDAIVDTRGSFCSKDKAT